MNYKNLFLQEINLRGLHKKHPNFNNSINKIFRLFQGYFRCLIFDSS
ncbi:hypothetical protein [Clostridium tetani]|nr:hypothetical protein [Clostridium tetani]CDI48984.1 hypothetical protein BN906_00974 [Clostridium tetani 12124569]